MTQQITAQLLKGGLTVDASGNVTATGTLSGTIQKVGTIKASDDTLAITITDSTGKVTLAGDLIVSGTTTTINSTTLTVDDKNIEMGSVGSPSDTTADGGGITLKGTTDKTITPLLGCSTIYLWANLCGFNSDIFICFRIIVCESRNANLAFTSYHSIYNACLGKKLYATY